jgi:hypothetical protein
VAAAGPAARITDEADHVSAETVLVSMNRGGLPHELFVNQIRRFASEVLPKLQAHTVRAAALAA